VFCCAYCSGLGPCWGEVKDRWSKESEGMFVTALGNFGEAEMVQVQGSLAGELMGT